MIAEFHARPSAAAPTLFGEGPIWHKGAIWYCDMPAQAVLQFNPETQITQRFEFDVVVACLASGGDRLFAGTTNGFAEIASDGRLIAMFDHCSGRDDVRMNDGVTDPAGRFIAGSMHNWSGQGPRDGAVWQMGKPDPCLTDIATANGLACSPDGETLYLSDSHADRQIVWRCAYDVETGDVGQREAWIDFRDLPGRPDGATVDAQGGYWIACIDAGRVLRFDPEGNITDIVHVPVAKTTKPLFAGKDLSTMYVTTAQQDGKDGRLYRVELPYSGIKPVAVDTAHFR